MKQNIQSNSSKRPYEKAEISVTEISPVKVMISSASVNGDDQPWESSPEVYITV